MNFFERITGTLSTYTLVALFLFLPLFESFFNRSFRILISLVFLIYIGLILRKAPRLTKGSWIYCLYLLIFTTAYYFLGARNNLIIHLLTICLGIVLFYNSLIIQKYTVGQIWNFAKTLWIIIYIALVAEFIICISGYQGVLYQAFPESQRAQGIPGYRFINNVFSEFFQLGFNGLNFLSLEAQAYGQFCAMLSIFSINFFQPIFRIVNYKKLIFFLVIPFFLLIATPNMTAELIFICIFVAFLLIQVYLNIINFKYIMIFIISLFGLFFYIFFLDLKFIRTYKFNLHVLYELFLKKQFEFIQGMSFHEYLIGANLEKYYVYAPNFEISYLTYAIVSGFIFSTVNLLICLKFFKDTLRQSKVEGAKNNLVLADIQLKNLLLVFCLILSTIHFPVVTSYIGTALFIFHFSFGLYILKLNLEKNRI